MASSGTRKKSFKNSGGVESSGLRVKVAQVRGKGVFVSGEEAGFTRSGS